MSTENETVTTTASGGENKAGSTAEAQTNQQSVSWLLLAGIGVVLWMIMFGGSESDQ